MKTININFTLTESEYELLRLGKCEKPNPQRIKWMLIQEASKNLLWMSNSVKDAFRRKEQAQIKGSGPLPTVAQVRADTQRRIKAEVERDRMSKRFNEKQRKLVLTKPAPSRAVGPLGHGGKHKLPLKSDMSSQPSWMDDDNHA